VVCNLGEASTVDARWSTESDTKLTFLHCLFKLIRWDALQTTKVTNRTRNRFPSLHPPLWIYIFKSFALMFNLEIQRYRYMFCRTGVLCTQEEQMEKNRERKKGKIRQDQDEAVC